eukprot:565927-Amphidinium_carterae.1
MPSLQSFITHDVDLLPSDDMLEVYGKAPPPGHAVHFASVWPKYNYPTFIGGVLAFSPQDFERINGFPNNYWGWGLEDDQLWLRMQACAIRRLGVRVGSFEDLDSINLKDVLTSGQKEKVIEHSPWLNADMFRTGQLHLDQDWKTNGLQNLRYEVEAERTAAAP